MGNGRAGRDSSEIVVVDVALAGQPNAGKTSLFNALTGSRRNVGNYPGVTVERRDGVFVEDQVSYHVVDLPGTYSLSAFSPEERIAEEELSVARPKVVVVVVDSTALRKSLPLLGQVFLLDLCPVLCLNMSDEADRGGLALDVGRMEQLLGVPVVRTAGHRKMGIGELKEAIVRAARNPHRVKRPPLGERLSRALDDVAGHLRAYPDEIRAPSWTALKLLLGVEGELQRVGALGESGDEACRAAKEHRARIEAQTEMDMEMFAATRFDGFARGVLAEVTVRPLRSDARAASDRIDDVLVHRLLGLPVFFAVMYAVFWLTFTVGEYPMGWIESGFFTLADTIAGVWPQGRFDHLRSLVVDGIIGGVGGVVVFLPNIALLFFGLAILEDTGYMARAAFLMDRVMHRFGLHGKSFLPLLTGFGCSVPGIMATRTLENERDRLITMLVLPLMSCGARLPIWMLLVPAFFAPQWRAPALAFIYGFGVLLALILALALRKTILRGEETPFVMELPPYRMPTARALVDKVAERSWLYLRKAGTVILSISVLMWFLSSYPKPDPSGQGASDAEIAAAGTGWNAQTAETRGREEETRAASQLQYSFAGRMGRALEPVLAPLGFDWKLATGMIGAFAAKEVFVAQMGIIHALGETDEESLGLREAISRRYSPLVGISLILFLLIATPCMATVAVTRRESGRWSWALLQFGGLTALAYVISLVVYQVGSLIV